MTTVAELEKETVFKAVPKRFSVADVHKMTEAGILPEESGHEIIDGYIIDKMSIGSKHAGTVKKINRILSVIMGNGAIISVQDPIYVDDFNEPEPDIALLKPRKDFYAESHPKPADVLLLIEVSDSTLEYDRNFKIPLYAESEIREFWIVNLRDKTVEIYTSPKNGSYRSTRILETGETIESNAAANLKLTVDEILGL